MPQFIFCFFIVCEADTWANICEEWSRNISSVFQYLLDETNNKDVIMEVFYRLPNQDNNDVNLLLEELRDTSKSNSLVLMSFNLPEINPEHLETKARRFLKNWMATLWSTS